MTVVTHPLPAVHAYEKADELVIEIELGAEGAQDYELTVHPHVLTVKVPRSTDELKDVWRIHADATPC
jgi:hypothetical protein